MQCPLNASATSLLRPAPATAQGIEFIVPGVGVQIGEPIVHATVTVNMTAAAVVSKREVQRSIIAR